MKATVHNLRREPMLPGDVYVGRAGHGHDGYWGNPWSEGMVVAGMGILTQAQAVELYEINLRSNVENNPDTRERVKALHGKRLFCFGCRTCHAVILSKMAAELHGEHV